MSVMLHLVVRIGVIFLKTRTPFIKRPMEGEKTYSLITVLWRGVQIHISLKLVKEIKVCR